MIPSFSDGDRKAIGRALRLAAADPRPHALLPVRVGPATGRCLWLGVAAAGELRGWVIVPCHNGGAEEIIRSYTALLETGLGVGASKHVAAAVLQPH